jgi:signal transduction histidine kinase
MKTILFLLLLSMHAWSGTIAQNNISGKNDKLPPSTAKEDTLKFQELFTIGFNNVYAKPDTGLAYAKQALEFSQKLNYPLGEAASYFVLGEILSQLGDYTNAINFGFKSLDLFQNLNDQSGVILATEAIGTHYRDQGDYNQALNYLLKAKSLTEALSDSANIILLTFYRVPKETQLSLQNAEIGFSYLTSKPDSALTYAARSHHSVRGQWLYAIVVIGDAYLKKGVLDSALNYFRLGLTLMPDVAPNDAADNFIGIANVFKNMGLYDSCIFFAKKGLEVCRDISYQRGIYEVSGILASVYENVDPLESIKYYKLNKSSNDSLFNQQKTRDAQSFAFNEQLHQQELQQKLKQSQLQYRNRLNVYIFLGGLFILLMAVGGLWRRNVFKQRSFALLQKQKQETDKQKQKVEETLEELKSTQAQLIQSEKMASLGELTAGIAHEIQNPLNFVNNFSEVNKELIHEASQANTAGNRNEVAELLSTLKDNEEKINHHGKRADAIVKGMLQHSRTGSGTKEPTDINRLADEYLRLAYQGFRARDKSFNATFSTEFDNGLVKVNIVPQDIGRVILNLINNAFYAVNERAKQGVPSYEPTVIVGTRRLAERAEISVKDNGNGISSSIKDKIFQPFFTTKPTGQGTGLGLSLAYDIVKAHGGEIKVQGKEGEGSEFIVELPI